MKKVDRSKNAVDESLPPLPAISSEVKLNASVRQAFEVLCQECLRLATARYQKWAGQHAKAPPAPSISQKQIEAAFQFLRSGAGEKNKVPTITKNSGWDLGTDLGMKLGALQAFLRNRELPPVAMVRTLMFTRQAFLVPNHAQWMFTDSFEQLVRDYWKHHEVGFALGLRELAAVFSAAGIPAEAIGYCRLGMWHYWMSFASWAPDATWPYFVEYPQILAQALDLEPRDQSTDEWLWKHQRAELHKAAFNVLAMFPRLPERFIEPCWEAALGNAKAERPWAQNALQNVPDKLERMLAGLKSGKQDIRASAAEWVSRLGDKRAIEPLKDALAKEKGDATKGAEMAALERLGVEVDEFLDRPGLVKEAEKGLAKGVPEDLAWFPFEQLPTVHWQDKGKRIPADVLKWWLVQTHKLKTPEPGVLLRRYALLMRPAEAAELGLFVLSAWIAHDTQLPSEAEITQKAQQLFQLWRGIGMTLEQALHSVRHSPIGSAIGTKGILALAGACSDGRGAKMVGDYLKEWYGMRAAQCKALVQMLGWIDHPAAGQLLLATARRFRTAGIRTEAEKCVKLLAERRDWTVAELADRSISDCGLDDDNQIVLDYGPRRFFARLDDELSFALFDAEKNPVAALPEPRKDEDAETVKKIKKQLTDAKKELKTVVKRQHERLYEAMCEQREWAFADWQVYLGKHRIVGRLCQRVIWAEVRDDKAVRTFRPLADGTLTGPDDTPVKIASDAGIRVAHDCLITAEVAKLWKNHLADYEVVPLFDQIGKPIYQLPKEANDQTAIRDFVGHMIEAFKLRGRATKLGYVRGATGDGGWFYEYKKQFPTLGIEAVIEFSGNGLPEENRTVALSSLSFGRTLSGDEGQFAGYGRSSVPLSEVPAILLSECYNDLKSIADQGTGFDPEWEKKVNQ
jgi:hypothetical protein